MAIIILIPLLPSFCKRQGHDTFFFRALLERKWNSFGKTNDKALTTRAISERSFICILLRDRRKHINLLLLLVLSKEYVRLLCNAMYSSQLDHILDKKSKSFLSKVPKFAQNFTKVVCIWYYEKNAFLSQLLFFLSA